MRNCLLIIFGFYHLSVSLNPGVVFQFHKNSIVSIKNKLIPKIYEVIRHVEIDQVIDKKEIKVKNMKVDLQVLTEKQVEFDFESDRSSLGINLNDLYINFKFDIAIDKTVKLSGKGKGKFGLKYMKFRTGAKPFDSENPRPFIFVDFKGLKIDRSAFDLELDIRYIPDFILDWIFSLFKDTIVDIISKEISEQAHTEGEKTATEIINKYYPLILDLPQKLSLSTKLTSAPFFDEEFIFLPMDGVFYDRDKGYSRDIDPSEMKIHQDDKSLSVTYVSQTSAEYLFQVFMGKKFHIEFGTAIFDFLLEKSENAITFHEGFMKIKGVVVHSRVEYLGHYIFIKPKISIDAHFLSFNKERKVVQSKLSNFRIESFTYETDFAPLSWAAPMVPFILKTFLFFKSKFSFGLEWLNLPFGMILDQVQLHECEQNIRLSVDISTLRKRDE